MKRTCEKCSTSLNCFRLGVQPPMTAARRLTRLRAGSLCRVEVILVQRMEQQRQNFLHIGRERHGCSDWWSGFAWSCRFAVCRNKRVPIAGNWFSWFRAEWLIILLAVSFSTKEKGSSNPTEMSWPKIGKVNYGIVFHRTSPSTPAQPDRVQLNFEQIFTLRRRVCVYTECRLFADAGAVKAKSYSLRFQGSVCTTVVD